MHLEDKSMANEANHRRGLSLFRSQSTTPRSASPRAFQLYELLHSRRMHSFTRRMKSFNKDRNPDLSLHPPSYMRQTCSSLIKRHSLCDQESNRRPKAGKSRRTTSMGGTTPVHRKGTKEQRRAFSSLEHARHDSMSFAPNDTLGFLLEEMPEGLSWVQGYGTNDALNGQSEAPSNRNTQGESHRRQPMQHSHRRHVSFDTAFTEANRKVTDTATVRTPKARPRALDRKVRGPSRPGSRQVKRTSVDRRSDTANNTSSGNFEDVVPTSERLSGTTRRRRARSALPMNERDSASRVQSKQTRKRVSEKKPAGRRMSQSQYSCRDPVEERSSSPAQPSTSKLSMNHHEESAHHEEPFEKRSEAEDRSERNSSEVQEACRVVESVSVEDEGISAPEKKEEEAVNDEVIEEKAEEQEVSDDDWGPMTYTTRQADEIFPVTPVAIDADQHAKEIRSQESHEGYCDALSKSLQSSEDSASSVSNSESASKTEHRTETASDFDSVSEPESESTTHEMIREEKERTACVLPVKRRRRSFLRLRRRESLSRAEEDTSNKQDPRSSQLMKSSVSRSPLASRLQCCRISFKACFCGADVSPGPETDDDADNGTHHQAVYFSE